MQRLFQIKIDGKVVGHINQFELKNHLFNCEVELIIIQKNEKICERNDCIVNVPEFEIPRLYISNVTKKEMDEKTDNFITLYFPGNYVIEE